MNNLDKIVLTLKDLVIEYKGKDPEFIANEIYNMMCAYNSSDRESPYDERTGVREYFFEMEDVLIEFKNLLR